MTLLQKIRSLDVRIQAAAVMGVFIALSILIHFHHASADLYAIYLAALNYGAGDLSAIYHNPDPAFNLSVPPIWYDQARDLGILNRQLYPFIYPPIWAAILSPLPDIVSPDGFALAAFVINPALLGLCAVLAYRIMEPRMGLILWMCLALGFMLSTSFGHVGLGQNQPQIIVSTLILLAVERCKYGSPIVAGGILALAAAIKLYPAIFVILWLATRNWRACGAFFVIGGTLGGLSVLVTGWALHQEFLSIINTIANTFLTCPICWNIDATITQWYLSDFLIESANKPNPLEVEKIAVTIKPETFRMLDKIFLLTVVFLLFRAARESAQDRLYRTLWPVAMLAIAIVSPLTWSYHYLSVVVFIPIFVEAYTRWGWAIFAGLIALLNPWTAWGLSNLPTPYMYGQILGTLCILVILTLFLRLKHDSPTAPP